MSQHLLEAQPQDEDVPPMDDPLDQPEPLFDFFGLGQQANPAPFFDAPEPMHHELQQLEGGGWGLWIQGGANVAPTANEAAHQQGMLMNLNLPTEDQDILPFDLNAALEEELDEPTNPHPAPAQDQLIMQHSHGPQPSSMISRNSMECVADSAHALKSEETQQAPDALLQNLVLALPVDANLNLNEGATLLPQDLLQEIHDPVPLAAHQVQGVPNQHLQVGYVRTYGTLVADPVFEGFTVQMSPHKVPSADLFRF
jgi:hypothetical protein